MDVQPPPQDVGCRLCRRRRRGRPHTRQWVQPLERRALLSAAFDVTGLSALRADANYAAVDGSGVAVAVLDTGIFAANPDLQGNVVAYYNAVTTPVPSSVDAASVQNARDVVGHGTHVAGTAASSDPEIGVATAADIVAIKVLADGNERQLGGDPLLRGLQFVERFAEQLNIKVVNMSLGSATESGGINYNFEPSADDIARAIDDLEALGVTVVSAAGNSYANDPDPGASYPAVVSTISVASTWSDAGPGHGFGTISWGSAYDNFGAFENSAAADRFSATSQRSTLDNQLAAPGVDIFSTWNNRSSDDDGGDLLHNTLSGTSMAAPFVAGVVALMQDAAQTFGGRYIEDVSQVLQILSETADTIVDTNVSDNGRVRLSNGEPQGGALNLPETGLAYRRVNVAAAVQRVRELYTGAAGGGPTPGPDTDSTTARATNLPLLNGTRSFNRRGRIGTDGLVIVGNDDVDLFRLDLQSPGNLTIALSLPGGGTAFGAALRVFDAAGNQINRADAQGGTYPSLVTDPNAPLDPGLYYLGISSLANVAYGVTDGANASGGQSQGDYQLTVSLRNPDPNGVAQGAEAVDLTLPDARVSATVFANLFLGLIGSDPPPVGSSSRVDVNDGDVDMFKVVAPDDGTLQARTEAQDLYGFDAADTYVRIFDANFNQIAFNDDISATDLDSRVSVAIEIGKTYYVAVTNFANRSFDPTDPYGRVVNSSPVDENYDLYLLFDNGDNNATAFGATPALIGSTVADRIGTDNGLPIAGANGGFKDVDFRAFTAAAHGLIDVTVAGTGTGGDFEPAMAMWEFDPAQGSIVKKADAVGDAARLIEQVTPGQTVYVSVTGRGNQNFNWFAKASGTGGQTGAYSLTTALRSTADLGALSDGSIQNNTPGALGVGQVVYGTIGMDGQLLMDDGDVDLYRFVAPADGRYDVRTETSPEGSADTVLRLFDAAGNEIAANDNATDRSTASALRATLAAGQTYYVGVSGAGSGASSYDPNTGAGVAAGGSEGSYGLAVAAVTASSAPAVFISDAAAVVEPALGVASAIFTVTLDQPAASALTLLYSTADGSAAAGSDYAAATGSITFAPGESSKTIIVNVLGDAENEADETFLVTLSAGDGAGDVIFTNAQGRGTIVNLQSTSIDFGGRTKATYEDADGSRVTLALSGPGAGQVVITGAGPSAVARLTLSGTSSSSSLKVTGDTSLAALTVQGSLKSLAGKTLDLAGDLSVSGSLGKLQFDDAAGGRTVTIGSSSRPMSIAFDQATDLSIVSGTTVKSLKANRWLDEDPTPDRLAAPSAGSISVKGDFGADVLVGSLKTLSVSGTMAGSTVRSAGEVGTVKARTLRDSRIYAGVRDDVDGLPDGVDDFADPSALIKGVSVTSKSSGAFVNTFIAAPAIGKLSLGSIATDNAGTTFGVAADAISSLTGTAGGLGRLRLRKLTDPGDSAAEGNFAVRIL